MKLKQGVIMAVVLCSTVLFSGCGVKQPKQDTSGGVYRSDDYAATFQQKVAIQGEGTLGTANILTFKLDPKESNKLYAGTPSGIFRSEDKGETWVKDSNNFQNVRDIEINPNNTKEIYVPAIVNGVGKIMKTTDGGENWQEVFTQRTPEGAVFTVAMNRHRPEHVFAGDSGGALYKTEDGGKTWKTIYWEASGIKQIIFDNINTNKIYLVTTGSGVKRSDDGGVTFVTINTGGALFTMFPHPYREGAIYISSEGGLYRSDDGGVELKQISTLVRPEKIVTKGIAIDPKDDKIIYFISGSAVYKTRNGGESWKPTQFNLPARKIEMIIVDPEDTKIMYLGTSKAVQKSKFNLFPF